MTSAAFAQVQAGWAALAVDALAVAGVRDVVISPGSRSTPLALAALRAPALRIHVVIDERTAAFFALGQARLTGRPTAAMCTSGTAGAHYLPALVEAAHSYTPMVVITADRPPELRGCGAPQTIDQTKLFGDAVRAFFDLGIPEATDLCAHSMRRMVVQAVRAARGPVPGPVHLNAPARKPLEPPPPSAEVDGDIAAWLGRARARRLAAPGDAVTAADPRDLDALAAACARARRPVIVCGPMAPRDAPGARAVAVLAERAGCAVFAETTSGVRLGLGAHPHHIDAFDALARAHVFDEDSYTPDLIIGLGATPASIAWLRFAAERDDIDRFAIAAHGWFDPTSTAHVVTAGAAGVIAHLTRTLAPSAAAGAVTVNATKDAAWLDRVRRANAIARAVVTRVVDDDATSEAGVAARTLAVLPPDAVLLLGNGLPVRLVDSFATAGAPIGTTVLCQRGANGIDGLIAQAAGVAALGERPVALLLGDVSLAHDVGSLAATRLARAPLAIVVIDNGGGRIFEQLPLAARAEHADVLAPGWLTPPALDLAALAAAFGVRYHHARTAADTAELARAAVTAAGCTLVHASVSPSGARDCYAAVDAALRQELRHELDDPRGLRGHSLRQVG